MREIVQQDMSKRPFIGVDHHNTLFDQCDFSDSVMFNGNFMFCVFKGCVFRNVIFYRGRFEGSTFISCDFRWSNMEPELDGTHMKYELFDQCRFVGCDLYWPLPDVPSLHASVLLERGLIQPAINILMGKNADHNALKCLEMDDQNWKECKDTWEMCNEL